ncbi:4-hydroxy-tetrahydrodipicolinate synthase [Parvicella tangerina]|uniref:4-hydroxy-tetrahydrodipicolinate synthase n=1 Tax=Parvicella tangerina TaxID=2829795 RepID=A0A916JLZ8_9FLAO|nr:4-hydroxy-tetrahydrodipicolinate synthase [Parvicella tangerina]CAG5081178.1 4-hydroxy-tetrahydrodipicolinate synthase [Parvicella tangerina]
MEKFRGLGVALVTPFLESGGVDMAGLQRLVEHNIKNGVDYLVVQGTTGESATLTPEEKQSVLDFVIEVNNGRKPIVLGIGGNNTAAIAKTLQELDPTGIDGILSVSPYYNKPTQEGIYQHYKQLNAVTPLPIILYNVPGRTGSNVTAQTTLRIAKEMKNIVAVKEASGNLEQVMEIIMHKPKGFMVLSGDDALTLPHIAAGGDGVISVVGNAFPKRFSSLVHAALEGDLTTARQHHYDLLEIIPLLFAEGNPAGVKRVLSTLGICKEQLRLPLVPVSKGLAEKLDDFTRALS